MIVHRISVPLLDHILAPSRFLPGSGSKLAAAGWGREASRRNSVARSLSRCVLRPLRRLLGCSKGRRRRHWRRARRFGALAVSQADILAGILMKAMRLRPVQVARLHRREGLHAWNGRPCRYQNRGALGGVLDF